MANFGQAPVTEVQVVRTAKPVSENAGERKRIAEEYKGALAAAIEADEALTVEVEEGELALTVKNRILAAAKALGHENDIVIQKRRNGPFVAFLAAASDEGMVEVLPEEQVA
jgi:hypothetical protein